LRRQGATHPQALRHLHELLDRHPFVDAHGKRPHSGGRHGQLKVLRQMEQTLFKGIVTGQHVFLCFFKN
jgi:hypothetical protein